MKTNKLISMVQFILDIDWMTTKEFCETYNVPMPFITGNVDACVEQLLQIDAIKHKMFVSYAKFLNKNLNNDMFIGNHKTFKGFEAQDVRGGYPRFESARYKITNDNFGFRLEPYDSVDGRRITKVGDLAGLDIEYYEFRF